MTLRARRDQGRKQRFELALARCFLSYTLGKRDSLLDSAGELNFLPQFGLHQFLINVFLEKCGRSALLSPKVIFRRNSQTVLNLTGPKLNRIRRGIHADG